MKVETHVTGVFNKGAHADVGLRASLFSAALKLRPGRVHGRPAADAQH